MNVVVPAKINFLPNVDSDEEDEADKNEDKDEKEHITSITYKNCELLRDLLVTPL